MWGEFEKDHRRGKLFGGLLIVIAGSLYLAKELGAQLPEWLFTWKTLLIGLGLMVGFKHRFRNPFWLVLMLVGGAFLLCDLYPTHSFRHILWPVLVIIFGVFIIFKPRRRHHKHWNRNWERMKARHEWHERKHHQYHRNRCTMRDESTSEEYLDSTTFMGGVKKIVLSKSFKGGDVTNVFGGSEINMSQADFEDNATLELTNIFGGTRLIIPPHWKIKSDLVSVFGSIEDKRPVQPSIDGNEKVLTLKGTTFFGGIDIKSY